MEPFNRKRLVDLATRERVRGATANSYSLALYESTQYPVAPLPATETSGWAAAPRQAPSTASSSPTWTFTSHLISHSATPYDDPDVLDLRGTCGESRVAKW